MKITDEQLRSKTDEFFRILYNLNKGELSLTSLGNSISCGFSFSDINLPLLDRNPYFSEMSKKYGIDLSKHKFARSENNSDEHIFDWIINNVSEGYIDLLNRRDYENYSLKNNSLIEPSEINIIYDVKSKDKIQDVLSKSNKGLANIVIYNGLTGSFLDNVTRGGKHVLTGGIKKDLSYVESILGYIQNNNRENNSNTQVYMCGVPRIMNTSLSNIFMNKRLVNVLKRYANVTYVKNFSRKPFYKVGNIYLPDPHYNSDEYRKLLYMAMDSMIENFKLRDKLIKTDRDLYRLNRSVELSLSSKKNRTDTLEIIDDYANLCGDKKIEFLKLCRNYLLERYPYDFYFLDKEAIKDEVKLLK